MQSPSATTSEDSAGKAVPSANLLAVIDIGASSIRMAIGEIDPDGNVHKLETLSQAVGLGRDTFTKGFIEGATAEQCVRVLRSYRDYLTQYDITDADQIRVVATSAVREAANRLTFLNRVYVATGFRVDPIDESEVNRITYLGIHPLIVADPRFADGQILVAEVGGGSTEVLLLQRGDVSYAHTFRMGSLRLRKTLETYNAPATKVRSIMEDHIGRIVQQVRWHLPQDTPLELIALGGDVRFAASQLEPSWRESGIAQLQVAALEQLTDEILELSVDDLVRKHGLTFPEAETLGPALLTYVHLARELDRDNLVVSGANLRDGLLQQIADPDAWSEEFRNQIIRSALDLGRRFQFDELHSRHVALLSTRLFHALQDQHQLDSRFELLLYLAALLHDIGHVVNTRSHHKHSMYLIYNSELFGLSQKDLLMTALVARYHRRASPKRVHEGFASLDWESGINVTKMAALLRVADALDRSNRQRVRDIECVCEDSQLVITAASADDLSLERLALKQKGGLFEEVYGMAVILRNA
jgi:exopolyphosphatase/guanosine-5'-triphosphate,3'-diphosphate pyrophosphatase